MEPFDIGLDGKEIEASPDFDDLPAEPPRKRLASENQQRKKKDYLIRKIQGSNNPSMNLHHLLGQGSHSFFHLSNSIASSDWF